MWRREDGAPGAWFLQPERRSQQGPGYSGDGGRCWVPSWEQPLRRCVWPPGARCPEGLSVLAAWPRVLMSPGVSGLPSPTPSPRRTGWAWVLREQPLGCGSAARGVDSRAGCVGTGSALREAAPCWKTSLQSLIWALNRLTPPDMRVCIFLVNQGGTFPVLLTSLLGRRGWERAVPLSNCSCPLRNKEGLPMSTAGE